MTLIICEKDNAARRIAEILSGKKFSKENYKRVPYYIYSHGGVENTVVGLRGHIINLDYAAEYNQWKKVDPKQLIRLPPTKQVTMRNIVTLLKRLSKEQPDCIIATDYDREGELIGVEGLDIIQKANPKIKALRARFSALTKNEIEQAFQSLSDIDYNLSASAETRQLIDLAWGASLTRFVSMASNRMGKEFLSVGRVQSPTLSLIVDKEKEIKAFIKKPYWEVILELDGMLKEPVKAKHVKDRFWKKEEAEEAYNNVKDLDKASVSKLTERDRRESPPAPFNTTSFLRSATGLGFSASRVMSIAEDLYTQGYISYPRTDNTVYPKTLDFKEILQTLSKGDFANLAKKLLAKSKLTPTRGKRSATDHPPIHPVGLAKKGDLDNPHWRIYELIVRRFFATLADPFIHKSVEAIFSADGEDFKAHGIKVISPGWREFYHYGDREKEFPDIKQGDIFDIIKHSLLDKETKPPKRFSQGALIAEMDKLGLGTKSTRHEIIQKLYDRGYISSSPPEPTLMGFAVVDALERFAEPITQSEMTARLEEDMNKIAMGEIKQEAVVTESQDMLEDVFVTLEKNKHNIGDSIKKALLEQNTIGKCPWCGNDMIVSQSRWGKRFASCTYFPQCRNSYPLPQKGRIISTTKSCDECRSPVIQVKSRGKRSWEICVNMNCPGRKDLNGEKKDRGKGKGNKGA
jgi:DNA topoisomerase-1